MPFDLSHFTSLDYWTYALLRPPVRVMSLAGTKPGPGGSSADAARAAGNARSGIGCWGGLRGRLAAVAGGQARRQPQRESRRLGRGAAKTPLYCASPDGSWKKNQQSGRRSLIRSWQEIGALVAICNVSNCLTSANASTSMSRILSVHTTNSSRKFFTALSASSDFEPQTGRRARRLIDSRAECEDRRIMSLSVNFSHGTDKKRNSRNARIAVQNRLLPNTHPSSTATFKYLRFLSPSRMVQPSSPSRLSSTATVNSLRRPKREINRSSGRSHFPTTTNASTSLASRAPSALSLSAIVARPSAFNTIPSTEPAGYSSTPRSSPLMREGAFTPLEIETSSSRNVSRFGSAS